MNAALMFGVFGLLAAAIELLGFIIGLRRFRSQLEHAPLPPLPAPPATTTVVHSVLFLGATQAGKTTMIRRIGRFRGPVTNLKATQEHHTTPPIPVCFDRNGDERSPVTHALQFRDVPGEKLDENRYHLRAIHREQQIRPGNAPLLLIWNMADPQTSRDGLSSRLLREMVQDKELPIRVAPLIVFFNKIDTLQMSEEELDVRIAAEQEHIQNKVNKAVANLPVTFLRGSALRGDGVPDCEAAVFEALGLGVHLEFSEGAGSRGAA